jgi:hypothetical protein
LVEEGASKTLVGGNATPKNLKPSQKMVQHKKGNVPKKDVKQEKRIFPQHKRRQGVEDTKTQETPLASTPKETWPPKWPIIHTKGLSKKAKVHKHLPKYMITEDEVDLMEEKV